MAKDPVFHAQIKHIETQHHFIREKHESNEIELVYCPTDEQIADILTKPLGRIKQEKFTFLLGIKENPLIIKGEY